MDPGPMELRTQHLATPLPYEESGTKEWRIIGIALMVLVVLLIVALVLVLTL